MDDPAEPSRPQSRGRLAAARLIIVVLTLLAPEAGLLDGIRPVEAATVSIEWQTLDHDGADPTGTTCGQGLRCERGPLAGPPSPPSAPTSTRAPGAVPPTDDTPGEDAYRNLNPDRAPPGRPD